MNSKTKQVVEKYKPMLDRYVKNRELRPENGVVFWQELTEVFYEETGDKLTSDKARTGSCGSCQGKVINHLVRLYESNVLEGTKKGNRTRVQKTPSKNKGGNTRKQNKPTNE